MADLRELLLDLNSTLQNNEIEAIAGAGALAGVEVTDELMADVKTKMSSLLTPEAAQNNNDIESHFKTKLYGTIKGELLGNIDTDVLSSAKELFGEDSLPKFKEQEFTGDKIKLFSQLAKEKLEKGGNDAGIKQINETLNKQVLDLTTAQSQAAKDWEKKEKKLNQGFSNTLIRKEFDAQFNTYNLGDKYSDDFVSDSLKNKIWEDANKVAKFTLSENGKVLPKDPTNDTLELFVDNKKVSDLKLVLDPLIKPYIKATNAGPNRGAGDYVPAPEVKKSRLAEDIIRRKEQMRK